MRSTTPDAYQPELSRLSSAWRYGLAALLGVLLWVSAAGSQDRFAEWWLWADLAIGAVALVLMRYRRRWPLATAAVVTLLGMVSMTSLGPCVVVTVSLATRRRWSEILSIGLFGVLCGEASRLIHPPAQGEPWWIVSITNVVATVAMLAIGMYIGSRRELLWTLRDRAERAEAEQGLRVAQARSTERARIAREMHDVLAHRISLVAMHSGALTYRTNLTPEQVARSAEVIHSNSQQALVDLRHVLGLLRDDAGAPDRPQPTYADLESLVQEATDSGMRIDLQTRVSTDGQMSEQTGRTLYRIVQEGLTNARKHAPNATVSISIAGDDDRGVDLCMNNPLPPTGHPDERPGRPAYPTSGLGLVGLAERAELAGGWLRTESSSSEFTLRGWLPWTA